MAKKSPTVVTLKEYVLGIAKVFPNAFFSVFSEQNNIKRHKVSAPELLHAKQFSPEMVTGAFPGTAILSASPGITIRYTATVTNGRSQAHAL